MKNLIEGHEYNPMSAKLYLLRKIENYKVEFSTGRSKMAEISKDRKVHIAEKLVQMDLYSCCALIGPSIPIFWPYFLI